MTNLSSVPVLPDSAQEQQEARATTTKAAGSPQEKTPTPSLPTMPQGNPVEADEEETLDLSPREVALLLKQNAALQQKIDAQADETEKLRKEVAAAHARVNQPEDEDVRRMLSSKIFLQRVKELAPARVFQPVEEREVKLSKIGKCSVKITSLANPNQDAPMRFTLEDPIKSRCGGGFTMIPFKKGVAQIPEDLVGWFESVNKSREQAGLKAPYKIER